MSLARLEAAEVITPNFDDLLEWYMQLHGFSTQVVTNTPELLDSRTNVRLYHLHGFLPLDDDRYASSQRIVFTRAQFVARLADEGSTPWNSLLLSRLHSKLLLGIGTSMTDINIDTKLELARQQVGETRPLGFVVNTHDDDDKARLLRQGLIPVAVDSHDEVPGLLLSVCMRAADLNVAGR